MSMERWVFVRDGKLYLHEENDGPTYLRRGPEASEREITLDELARRHTWQGAAEKLLAALIEQEQTHKFLMGRERSRD